MIKVSGLNKHFSVHKKEPGFWGSAKSLVVRKHIKKHALQNIDLELDSGEIIGLIGSNGAGKTTLTKVLSGIIHPSAGEVSVLGFDPWAKHNDYRRQMALIMGQKAQLWWDLPAMDGFLLLKEIYQIPHREFYDQIEYLAEYLQVKEQLNIQIRRLSLGERMKVELMAALLHKPKVIFLDEPTIGLDLSAQKAVRRFIKEYRKEYNPTMILTSHYMDDIEQLCPRIAILKEGNKIYDGELSYLHQKFASNKVITFYTLELSDAEKIKDSFPKELGQLTQLEKKIDITCPRDQVMDATKFVLNCIEVKDFSIHEEEIGDIIQSIQESGAVGV